MSQVLINQYPAEPDHAKKVSVEAMGIVQVMKGEPW